MSSCGFSCIILWLFSDPHETAVSQNYVRLKSVSIDKINFIFVENRDSFITPFILSSKTYKGDTLFVIDETYFIA